MTNRIIDISGGKTKNCITVITVEGVDLDTFLAEFDRLQSENSPENLAVDLAVAPDHYYLGITEDGYLEVIETCGNTPVQSRFFITYGDMDALNSIRDQKYEYQSAGVARTSAGRVEGGMAYIQYLTLDGVLLPVPDSYEVRRTRRRIPAARRRPGLRRGTWCGWVRCPSPPLFLFHPNG